MLLKGWERPAEKTRLPGLAIAADDGRGAVGDAEAGDDEYKKNGDDADRGVGEEIEDDVVKAHAHQYAANREIPAGY